MALVIATVLPIRPAAAESVFAPYRENIREQIPLGLSTRLPERIFLTGLTEQSLENFSIQVFVTPNPSRLTLSLYGCKNENNRCLVGSFITESIRGQIAQNELARHQSQGEPITLKSGLFGYVLDSEQPQSPSAFVTMMWEQDNMIHTLSFPQRERQNMLYMAVSMAQSDSLFRP